MSADGLERSVVYYQHALEKDPGFALAHAGLADSYCLLGFFDLLPPAEAMPKAKESAVRAMEGVKHADACWGLPDVFAYIETPDEKSMNRLVMDSLQKLDGVERTETHIVVE